VCYYIPAADENEHKILWTGDTLFVGGCGRILECDARTMWNSLLKLASLPDDTLVYCGHDYTQENYEFALTIEPDNEAVKQRFQGIIETVRTGGLTVPSVIFQEKATNIFLRSDTEEVKTALNMPRAGIVDVFAELRRRKDVF
jgi:hydroxyacylglutathione hydrolase